MERKEAGDLLALLPQSLYSSQHHLILPNKARQQCCEHKTNLPPGLIATQVRITCGEDHNCAHNTSFKEQSVPKGYAVHSCAVAARAIQHNILGHLELVFWGFVPNLSCKCTMMLVSLIAGAVLHIDQCDHSFVISVPTDQESVQS